VQQPDSAQSKNLDSIVSRVRPAVEAVIEANPQASADRLVELGVRANVRVAANQLRNGSVLLERLVRADGLLIVGAEYSLETGEVDFFDGMPQPPPG